MKAVTVTSVVVDATRLTWTMALLPSWCSGLAAGPFSPSSQVPSSRPAKWLSIAMSNACNTRPAVWWVICAFAMAIKSKLGKFCSGWTTCRRRASLAIVTKALDELTARQARLEAERDGADVVQCRRTSRTARTRRRCRGRASVNCANSKPDAKAGRGKNRSSRSESPSSAKKYTGYTAQHDSQDQTNRMDHQRAGRCARAMAQEAHSFHAPHDPGT